MASLASPSNPQSPFNMARWARKCERYCCLGATYFPLVFVYTLTSWAVWVEASIGFEPSQSVWIGKTTSLLGILLFLLLNWSYTTAVFTNPGSTTETYDGYNSLPTIAPPVATSFTVKSTGELRFCKKCQARKPDRAHHCSTCKRCVLKMDHHCPWLATCVGLRNYKAFLLFLIYTTIFCFLCFAVSGSWFWIEVMNDGTYGESLMPINYVMLAVMSGIIGLVLAGFTGWHILLASRGQTTIECLEKTRYLSPLRKAMQHQHIASHEESGELSYGQQLADIHTNALPGVTRPEEGETVVAPYVNGQPYAHQSYDAQERQKARQRYEEYLDEQDSDKLPSAFDLGWKKNLLHLFGRRKALWFIPVVTTTGNGWSWEPSPKWLQARERMRQDREVEHQRASAAGWGNEAPFNAQNARQPPVESVGAGRHYLSSPSPRPGARSPSKADRILGREPSEYADSPESGRTNSTPMKNLRMLDSDDEYASSNDGFEAQERETDRRTGGWNGQRVTTASGLLGKQAPMGLVRSDSGNTWREPRDSEEVD